MSANLFKEKTEEKVRLKEVCGKCGKVKDTDPVAGGSEFCTCQSGLVTPNSALALRDHSLDKPNEPNSSKVSPINLGDQYEVLEMIGQGGMGTVYRVKDKTLNKEFAVKVLRDELATDEFAIKRFEQEASSASDLTHANMLAVYGHGKTTSGSHFIVMDLLEGESLAQLLKREGNLDAARTINISAQICDALAHAHMKGLVHRDLKPSNIMLTNRGQSSDIVKVLDFGIAKLMPSSNRETQNLTQTGELFGSPSYMSPEQCLGCSQDARSDIYSLGCMMYEMLTGKPPFAGKNPIQTVVMHLNEEPLPPSNLMHSTDIPKGLESTIMRCLEKDAEQRYQSMEQVAADLRLIASGQAPKQKKKKGKKPIDLLAPPLLAIYVGLSMFLCFSLPSDLSVNLLGILWMAILSFYFWRWLASKRGKRQSVQEKWRVAFVWCSLSLSTLALMNWLDDLLYSARILLGVTATPRIIFEQFHYMYGMWIASLLGPFIGMVAIPTAGLGWLYSWASSKPQRSKLYCPIILTSVVLIPTLAAIFARPQIAWIPEHTALTLRSRDCGTPLFIKRLAGALRDLAIFINPDFTEAYYERGAFRREDKQVNAINDFDKVLEKGPKDNVFWPRALMDRVQILYDTRHYDMIVKDLSHALAIRDDKTLCVDAGWCYRTRAKCYEQLKQYELALSDYTKAIHEREDSSYFDRARVNVQLGNYPQALSDYCTAIELNPHEASWYASRAALYTKLGEKSKAMADYLVMTSLPRRTYSEAPELAKIEKAEDDYYYAIAHEALGHKEQAQALFDSANKGGYSAEEAKARLLYISVY